MHRGASGPLPTILWPLCRIQLFDVAKYWLKFQNYYHIVLHAMLFKLKLDVSYHKVPTDRDFSPSIITYPLVCNILFYSCRVHLVTQPSLFPFFFAAVKTRKFQCKLVVTVVTQSCSQVSLQDGYRIFFSYFFLDWK